MSLFGNGYSVVWHDQWDDVLDDALRCLPEMDGCPHELYRLLIQTPGPSRKRIALVMHKADVAAVVGLRWQWQRWDPVSKWILPGAPFPYREGCFFDVLAALGVESRLALWRCDDLLKQAPSQRIVRTFKSSSTHKLRLTDTVDEYWRNYGSFFKNIRKVRNRCKDFAIEINSPGAASWITKNWEKRWRKNLDVELIDISDRLTAVDYLEGKGRCLTLQLFDKGNPIAGISCLHHNEELVAQYNCRNLEYDKYGLGLYLYDRLAHYAKDNGFALIDIGGGHDYKDHWAPQDGEKMEIDISPEWNYRLKQTKSFIRRIKSKIANLGNNFNGYNS